MTKKETYQKLLTLSEVKADAELVQFITHEIELLNRKNTTPKKPTATQIENSNYKNDIVEYLTENSSASKSIKELQAEIGSLAELTNQRIAHLLTDLVKNAVLKKEYVKKTPYYSIAS